MVNGYGRKQLIPVHTEESIFNFYLNKEVKSTETKIVNNSQYGMVWYGMVWYGMVWYGMVWYGMVWYGMVWYGMVWYGVVWYGMVWYGLIECAVHVHRQVVTSRQLAPPAV